MGNTVHNTAYLLSCAVNEVLPDAAKISSMNLEDIYDFSKKHMVSASVAVALTQAGIKDIKFSQSLAQAQRKAIILENDIADITDAFEANAIWYMPLKGYILKDLYPQLGMREMTDIDILIDKTKRENVMRILQNLGFSVKRFGTNNVDVYQKPPLSNIEIHNSLFGYQHDKKIYEYYSEIKPKLLKDACNEYGYHFTSADFYIFMIAHEYKHYINSGTGIRSLLDTYVYLKKHELDFVYIQKETSKLGISEFEKTNRNLAFALFDSTSECDTELLEYFVESGTFGSIEHLIDNNINRRKGGKLSYLVRRIFGVKEGNYWDYLKQRHPIFYKYRILLPFLPFYRIAYGIRKYPKRIKKEITYLLKK